MQVFPSHSSVLGNRGLPAPNNRTTRGREPETNSAVTLAGTGLWPQGGAGLCLHGWEQRPVFFRESGVFISSGDHGQWDSCRGRVVQRHRCMHLPSPFSQLPLGVTSPVQPGPVCLHHCPLGGARVLGHQPTRARREGSKTWSTHRAQRHRGPSARTHSDSHPGPAQRLTNRIII